MLMLTMTDEAISTIQRIETAPDVPRGSGVRISSNQGDGGLAFHLAEAPMQGDEVIAESGAVLFVDEQASALLAEKTLDAIVNPDGQVQFSFADQRL